MKIKIFVIGLFLLVLVSSGCIGYETKDETQLPTTTAPPTTAPQTTQPVVKEFINESFEEICKIFEIGSNLTLSQKNEIFEAQYRDKYVKWSGKVTDVLGIPAYIIVSVNLTSTCDINVFFDPFNQEDILNSLEEGDDVTFVARLIGHSRYPTLFARDGEIVS